MTTKPYATATGSLAAFTKNLSPWLGATAPTEAIAVVLIGFPDLEPDDGGDGNDGNPMMNVGTCRIYPAGYASVNGISTAIDGSCPSGQTLVKMLPRCPDAGAVTAVPEIGSSVTYGTVKRYEPNGLSTNDIESCQGEQPSNTYWQTQCQNWFDSVKYASNVITNGIVTINNVAVSEEFCAVTSYEYRPPYWSRPTPFGGHVARFPQGRRDALCCTPP